MKEMEEEKGRRRRQETRESQIKNKIIGEKVGRKYNKTLKTRNEGTKEDNYRRKQLYRQDNQKNKAARKECNCRSRVEIKKGGREKAQKKEIRNKSKSAGEEDRRVIKQ